MSRKLLSVFVAVYRRGREERRETNKKWKLFTLFSVYPLKTLRPQRSLRWAGLLSVFLAVSLLFTPSISLATEVMTRYYTKTIGALDSYTKLLIHGDSIGDATGKTVTANGNAAVTTAQYKFAELGRSIVFDGTGDYLSLADSDDWDFGSGDYTIDFWVRFNTLPSAGNQVVFYSHKYAPTNRAVQFRMYNNSGAYQLGYYVQDLNSSNPDLIAIDVAVSITTGTWYHIAAVRNGTNTRVYLNGSSVGYNTQSYTYPNFDSNLWIGCEYGTIKYLDGWMKLGLARM